MFDVAFSVVPPGGGETDFEFRLTLPAVPNTDDYIRVGVEGGLTTEDFIVRRRWFFGVRHANPSDQPITYKGIVVEVEPALSASSSDDHKRMCEMYSKRGKTVREHQDSVY